MVLTARAKYGLPETHHQLLVVGSRRGTPRSVLVAGVAPERIGPPSAPDLDVPPALARVSEGRWLADCPDCPGAEEVTPGDPFLCGSCFNGTAGFRYRPVAFPPDEERLAIEAALDARPLMRTRNWEPGEPTAGLRAENVVHGVEEAQG